MPHFNYHATIQKRIKERRLINHYYKQQHNAISNALMLVFDDGKEYPIRPDKHEFYEQFINQFK